VSNPIFILSTSPRTGSTWLQRVLTSTGDILIWGENTTLTFPYGDHWTPDIDVKDNNDLHFFKKHRANMRMASISPFFTDVFNAQKVFLESLYSDTAKKEGFDRWGVKETYWTDITLKFINWAWPDAKILFLTRRFTEAFSSNLKTSGWHNKYQTCCRRNDVRSFCENWIRQVKMIVDYTKQPSNAKLLMYEDLVDNRTLLSSVCKELGLGPIVWALCGEIIGSARKTLRNDYTITDPADICFITEYMIEINSLSEKLGYKLPVIDLLKKGQLEEFLKKEQENE